MKKHLPLFLLSCATIALGWGVVQANAQAPTVANLAEIQQAAIGLTAIPPRLGDDGSLTAKPGETLQTQIRVRNTTPKTLNVATTVEDFIIGADGRTPIPVDAQVDSRWSLAKWITLPIIQSTVFPGGSQTLPVTIHVPENALPGGHYAMILHEPKIASDGKTPEGQHNAQTGVSPRVGTLVYLRVAGDVKEDAAIRNLQVPPWQEFGPVTLKFDVENLSDIHITPAITVKIADMFGRKLDVLPADTMNIFPYTQRSYAVQWDKVWGFGRYTAEVAVQYGDQGKSAVAKTHFWIVPIKLILAILTILLALIGIAVAIRRHWQHRSGVEQQHIELLEGRIRQLEDELHDRHE